MDDRDRELIARAIERMDADARRCQSTDAAMAIALVVLMAWGVVSLAAALSGWLL
jgi:hypothetical protein